MNAGKKCAPQAQAQKHRLAQSSTQTLKPGVVQPKTAPPNMRNTPAAPAVYRPQPVPKCLQPKATPGGARPHAQPKHTNATNMASRPEPRAAKHVRSAVAITVRSKASVQPKTPHATTIMLKVNRTSTVIQRAESSGGSPFDNFVEAAWVAVEAHWDAAEETNPGAVENTRTECTEATFRREGFGPEVGTNTDAHAEWTPVARFYVSFPGEFPQIVKGGTLECAGSKPTCFLCAAIAHTLGIKLQKKDRRGYGAHYALPGFILEDHVFRKFVGATAFAIFEQAGKPQNWVAKLPNQLYLRHKAKGKYF